MNKISSIKSALIVLFALTTLVSCKKEFDSPPFPTDPNIVVNTSISDFKKRHTTNGAIEEIVGDTIISGVVIANDKSGNFYKQIFIHDSTGAMQILIDGASLFNTYPIGRKVFIKCKGLALGDYKGTMVLGVKALVGGVYSVQGIPSSLSYNYVLGGSLNNPVLPVSVSTITQLGTTFSDRYMNELIKMDAMEFTKYNVVNNQFTYGDTSNYKSTIYRYITPGCNSRDSIEVTTSGYSNFAGTKLPRGNGSIIGIYSISRTSPTSANAYKQMMLRDTNDIQFYGSRCGNSNPNPTGTRMTIAQLRAMYTTDMKITTSSYISGVVTSDAANKNISTGSAILQDESGAAVTVYFGGTLSYNIGDSISFDITNDSLLSYRGSLEVKANTTTPPTPLSTGRTIVPVVKTIAQVNTAIGLPLGNPGNFELSLIKISNATATGNATYSGNNTLTDGSGSITLYTAAAALFSASPLPSGSHNWTGQAKNYNGTTKEFLIRNTTDVQ